MLIVSTSFHLTHLCERERFISENLVPSTPVTPQVGDYPAATATCTEILGERAQPFRRRSAARRIQVKKNLGSFGSSEPTVSTPFKQAAHSG